MRPTHYLRRNLETGDIQRIPFDVSHYREAGLLPSTSAGMPILEAYQLANKWNLAQSAQRFVYGLE